MINLKPVSIIHVSSACSMHKNDLAMATLHVHIGMYYTVAIVKDENVTFVVRIIIIAVCYVEILLQFVWLMETRNMRVE